MDIQLSEEISGEYLSQVMNILDNEEFLTLGLFEHHRWTNRLVHSMNVSYLSWGIAKKLGWDERAAARAGLLHDFCPYDFKEKTPTGEHQAFFHPKAAVANSTRCFEISEREKAAIRTHMFPLGPIPKNKEAWIITFVDKGCALMELCHIAVALARRNRVVVDAAY